MKKAKVDLKIVQRCRKTVVEQMLSVKKNEHSKSGADKLYSINIFTQLSIATSFYNAPIRNIAHSQLTRGIGYLYTPEELQTVSKHLNMINT